MKLPHTDELMFYATMIITKSQTKNEIVTFQHYITCKHQGLLLMMKLKAFVYSKIKIKFRMQIKITCILSRNSAQSRKQLFKPTSSCEVIPECLCVYQIFLDLAKHTSLCPFHSGHHSTWFIALCLTCWKLVFSCINDSTTNIVLVS